MRNNIKQIFEDIKNTNLGSNLSISLYLEILIQNRENKKLDKNNIEIECEFSEANSENKKKLINDILSLSDDNLFELNEFLKQKTSSFSQKIESNGSLDVITESQDLSSFKEYFKKERELFIRNFSEESLAVINLLEKDVLEYRQRAITVEWFTLVLLSRIEFLKCDSIKKLHDKINEAGFQRIKEGFLDLEMRAKFEGDLLDYSPRMKVIADKARGIAKDRGSDLVSPCDLFESVLGESMSFLDNLFKLLGINPKDILYEARLKEKR